MFTFPYNIFSSYLFVLVFIERNIMSYILGIVMTTHNSSDPSVPQYNEIINFAPIGFYQSSRDGQFLFVNQELLYILGYSSREDLYKKNMEDIYYSSEEREKLISIYDRNPKPQVKNVEVKFKKKSGEAVWALLTSRAIKDEAGSTIKYDGFVIDISERKKTEELLTIKENALEASLNAIGITDMDGNMIYVNQATLDLWQYKREDILGKPIINFWTGNGIYKTLSDIETKGFSIGEDTALRKDGSIVKVQYSATTVMDKENKPSCIFASFFDISDKKKAENELRESQSMLDTVLHNLPGGFVQIDENYTIHDVNKMTCDISGFSKKELVGVLCDIICPKGSLSKKCPVWEDGINEFVGMDTFIKCKDGTQTPIMKNAVIIKSKDKKYVLENFQDMTEVKKNEADLKNAKHKAEESDRLKSAFLANMSHEIRTPMNTIIGFSELLSSKSHSLQEKESFIETIQSSSKRLLNTVNDILEISKIETNQTEIRKTRFNLCRKIREIFNSFVLEAENKNLKFIIDRPLHACDIQVSSDETKLESVITNLIKNAIKFSHNGNIHVGLSQQDNSLTFFCRDEGIGILKERQEAIFNRFEQADIEDRNVYEGSGLGLAISKAYIDMLGGKIWVESKFGKGSTFFFTIPDTE